MDRRNIKQPKGMQVPRAYWNEIDADQIMKAVHRSKSNGMEVPENYFQTIDPTTLIQQAQQKSKVAERSAPIIQLRATYRALIATAAVILCLLWLDSLISEPLELSDISTGDLEMALLMESEYLLAEKLADTQTDIWQADFAPDIQTDEMELELLNAIENLDLWYD